MKNYLLAGAMVLGLFNVGLPLAHADMVPEDQKMVVVCAEMKGIANLPRIVVLAREKQIGGGSLTVWKVNEGDCVDLRYKFNSLDLYGVDAEYATTLDLKSYDPETDSKAYKSNPSVNVTDLYVDLNSELTYRNNSYVVAGVDNANRQLVLLSAGFKTNLADEITTPNFPSGLSAAIGSQVAIDDSKSQADVFTDVASDSTYYNALAYLKANGVVSGYADGSFKPGNTINRAEFTKIIASSVYPETQDCALTDPKFNFSDIVKTAWYADFICVAFDDQVISGYPDGSFRPEQNINFAESAKIIAKAFRLQLASAVGMDPWYKVYVEALVSAKAIPMDIKRFDQPITRGQMAEIAFRVKANNMTLPTQTYSDLK